MATLESVMVSGSAAFLIALPLQIVYTYFMSDLVLIDDIEFIEVVWFSVVSALLYGILVWSAGILGIVMGGGKFMKMLSGATILITYVFVVFFGKIYYARNFFGTTSLYAFLVSEAGFLAVEAAAVVFLAST